MKVLLVENEADITRLISYVLNTQGIAVQSAYDAVEADEQLRRESFDLILLDLMLPGEDGYSFCRRLKADERTSGIPVVIISARVMPEEIRRGLDCGASGYITKPYNPTTLGDELRRIWAREKGAEPPPPVI